MCQSTRWDQSCSSPNQLQRSALRSYTNFMNEIALACYQLISSRNRFPSRNPKSHSLEAWASCLTHKTASWSSMPRHHHSLPSPYAVCTLVGPRAGQAHGCAPLVCVTGSATDSLPASYPTSPPPRPRRARGNGAGGRRRTAPITCCCRLCNLPRPQPPQTVRAAGQGRRAAAPPRPPRPRGRTVGLRGLTVLLACWYVELRRRECSYSFNRRAAG